MLHKHMCMITYKYRVYTVQIYRMQGTCTCIRQMSVPSRVNMFVSLYKLHVHVCICLSVQVGFGGGKRV